MADWLPDGWRMETKVAADGTRKEFYTNDSSGQMFYKEADMKRYANYLKNVEPNLERFKKCYMEGMQYVNRPWETDPYHTIEDYLQGRVGLLKEAAEGNTSASMEGKMPMPMEIPKQEDEVLVGGSLARVASAKKKRRRCPSESD